VQGDEGKKEAAPIMMFLYLKKKEGGEILIIRTFSLFAWVLEPIPCKK
jgi:hypothetical protein